MNKFKQKRDINFKIKILLLFIMLYFSVNSFSFLYKYYDRANIIMVIVAIIYTVASVAFGRNSINNNIQIVVLFITLNVLMTCLIYGYTGGYFMILLDLVICLATIRLFTKEEFYNAYTFIIELLSVLAIVVGVISVFIPDILRPLKHYSLSVGSTYADAFLCFQMVGAKRINSIWGEPGMYAVFLILAIFFELFNSNKTVNIRKMVIFSIAMLFTFSPTGYVCYFLLLVAYLLNEKFNTNKLIVFIVVAIVFLAVSLLDIAKEQMETAVDKLFSENISFVGRVAPIYHNLKLGFKNPIFGTGISSAEKFYVEFLSYRGYLLCNTSTTTFIFKTFGIFIPTVWIVSYWKIACGSTKKLLARFFVFIALLININTQNVTYDQIIWITLIIPFLSTNIIPEDNRPDLMN